MARFLARTAALALAVALVIVGVFLFRYITASPPLLPGDFVAVMGERKAVPISAPDFAADFNRAALSGKRALFGSGEKIGVLLSESGSFVLSRTENGLLVSFGGQNYIISADVAAELALHEELMPLYLDVYPRPLVVELEGRKWHVPPMSGRWEYMGIDGRFHEYIFGEMCPQAIRPGGDTEVRYAFEGAAAAPHVLFGDGFGQTESSEPAGGFSFSAGDVISLVATPEYDSPQYRGSLDFALSFEMREPAAAAAETEAAAPAFTAPPVADVPKINPADENDGASVEDSIFLVSATETFPGEMLRLNVKGVAADEVAWETDLRAEPRFFDDDEGAVALLPVRLSLEPGDYTVKLSADGRSSAFDIAVKTRDFVVQHLQVAAETTEQTILSAKANAEYDEKIEPLKSIYDPRLYTKGSFILPIEGRVTTEFGTKRYINGSSTPSWHAAIDIGAATGTKIKAANAGRVLFSEYIALTGNTILIEHGLGLKSWYYHMDTLAVSAGDMVAQGEIIGTVGSTGFSTGPHLHFGMSVGEYYVNPWSFID